MFVFNWRGVKWKKAQIFVTAFKAKVLKRLDDLDNVTETTGELGVERNNIYTWIKLKFLDSDIVMSLYSVIMICHYIRVRSIYAGK